MQKLLASMFLVGFLAACEDTAATGGGGSTTTTATVVTAPAVLAQNLNAVTYDSTAETLTVDLYALDASPLSATYTRRPALDIGGFQAFEVQETSLHRDFIALFKDNPRGNLTAGIVADGGQFGSYFGGGTFARTDLYTAPTNGGLASYLGNYVGLQNANAPGGRAPSRVTGDAWLNVDFTNDAVNGQISNRTVVHDGSPLTTVFLYVTDLNSDGSFNGNVILDLKTVGDYGGIFGGLQASDVAGLVVFNPIKNDTLTVEHGVFVLPKCGTAGDHATCP